MKRVVHCFDLVFGFLLFGIFRHHNISFAVSLVCLFLVPYAVLSDTSSFLKITISCGLLCSFVIFERISNELMHEDFSIGYKKTKRQARFYKIRKDRILRRMEEALAR